MNAKQLKDYFEHPEKMDASALISLQQAVQDFPYAAALQMLYMKVLKNEDSYQLPAQVKRTAISVPDPSLLKAFYDSSNKHELPAITFDIDALKAQAKTQDNKKKPASEDSKKTSKSDTDQKTSEVLIKEEEKAEPVKKKVSKPSPAKREPGSLDHLPESVRNAILRSKKLNSSASEKSVEESKTPIQNKEISQKQKPAVTKAGDNSTANQSDQQEKQETKEVKSQPETDDIESIQVKEDVRIMPFSEKASFLEWLNADHQAEVKRIDSTQEFAKIEVVEEEQESEEGEIRKIIQQLPKFESTTPDGKINVFNLEADEEGRFVTETLAEIYFNQRVFDKAIKAYEILSLKYPEKSSFFADRIRAIKKEKNS